MKTVKRVLILHGWGADSGSNWFPWLKKTMERRGFAAYCPDLPDSEMPQLPEWLKAAEIAKPFDSTLSAVGHSLGAVTLLRLLEGMGKKEKIDKAILVSGFARDLGIEEIRKFIEASFDWDKIRKKAKKFFVIHGANDPVVPVEFGKEVADKLAAEFILERNGWHLNAGAGDFTYPRVAELLEGKS